MKRKIWFVIRLLVNFLVIWFGVACGSPMYQIIIGAFLLFMFDVLQYYIDD